MSWQRFATGIALLAVAVSVLGALTGLVGLLADVAAMATLAVLVVTMGVVVGQGRRDAERRTPYW